MQKEWKYAAAKRAWDYSTVQDNSLISNFLKSHLLLWSLTHETQIVVRQPLRLFVLESIPGSEPLTLLNSSLPFPPDNKLFVHSSGWYRGPPGESQPINALFIHASVNPATREESFLVTDFLFLAFQNVRLLRHRENLILYIDNIVSTFSMHSGSVVLIEKDRFNTQALVIANLIIQVSEKEGDILDETSEYEGEGFIIESSLPQKALVIYTPTSKEELFVLQDSLYSSS